MAIQKLKGLWIPSEILLNEELTDKEKVNQILLLIGFFIVLLLIGIINKFIRHKINKKKK